MVGIHFIDTADSCGVRIYWVVSEEPMKITPLEKQQVSGPAVAIYEELERRGKVINFFKVLAYKPEILKSFMEFYEQVWREGKLPAATKELAYLRTSILNGCAY
jgi:alkylhydroperoxidase family enzyme